MREIALEKIKAIELEILKQVHAICEKNGFRYTICGGTLLGAIRHKGFIPWDDDIDIIMPKEDYDSFIEYCKKEDTPFDLLCYETNNKYGYLFAKAMAKNTIIVEENSNRSNIGMGVHIDIFPAYGLGNSHKEALSAFTATRFYRELLVAANWKKYFKSQTHSICYEPIRFSFFVLSRLISSKSLINIINKKYKNNFFDNYKFVGAISGSYREKEIMSKEFFDEYITLSFENCEFKAIKGWDKYLTKIYGDYMKLPPKNKQVSHHTFKAYYKD